MAIYYGSVPPLWLRGLTDKVPMGIPLSAGLILIADLQALAKKNALCGVPSLHHAFLLAPGLHKLKDISQLSKGEYPACGAMTTGYVFRIENEAMVYYMQQVGRPGQLTTLSVTSEITKTKSRLRAKLLYSFAALATVIVLYVLAKFDDMTALGSLLILLGVNITNMILMGRRTKLGWKGQKEPGIKSDLIVLLSQDRWIRVQGMTDDVKAVTSGQWMRQPSAVEDLLYTFMTVAVHISAGMLFAAGDEARFLVLLLMLFNTTIIEIANALTDQLVLYGRTIKIAKDRRAYSRRLEMAKELVDETGTDNWCEKLGIILTKDSKHSGNANTGAAHM